MALEYSYIENNGVLLQGKGIVTANDVYGVNSAIYATEQQVRSIAYQLCDYTKIERLEMSSTDVIRLSRQDINAAKINLNMIIAVVGNKDQVYGFLRMWQSYVEEVTFEKQVFREVNHAKAWISQMLDGK